MEVSACSGNCDIISTLKCLFDTVLCDRNSVIRFLVIHGVIKDEYCCPKCGSLLKLNKHKKFGCVKKVYIGGEQTRCRVLSSG